VLNKEIKSNLCESTALSAVFPVIVVCRAIFIVKFVHERDAKNIVPSAVFSVVILQARVITVHIP
jgi:hypothetical protein